MTPADAAQRCTAAGLTVLSAARVGGQICVLVKPLPVTPETVVKRLGVPVTIGFGSGSGNVQLWFEGDGE